MAKIDIKPIIVGPNTTIMLTTPEANGRTCVYVRLIDGKLVLEGGASLLGAMPWRDAYGAAQSAAANEAMREGQRGSGTQERVLSQEDLDIMGRGR